jgi:hypothetical protein
MEEVSVMRIVLDLDGEETRIVRLLKHLLRVLGRVHGVRCRAVSATKGEPCR